MPSPGKKGSPSKKSGSKSKSPKKSPKGTKSPIIQDAPIVIRNVKKKQVWTGTDIRDHNFEVFRCPCCFLALSSFQKFIEHCCWRKYYIARFHLGLTQAFACRMCNFVFYSHSDYATHLCFDNKRCDEVEKREVEDVLPIEYSNHHDFYISWSQRTEKEKSPHDPDYTYVCKCCKCNNKFKTKILYLLHSCCSFALLKPAQLRRLKICMHCKYVFLNEFTYEEHVTFCNSEKAFCVEFLVSLTEIACQQFVIGRHCYEFDHHLHTGACFLERKETELPDSSPVLSQPPKFNCMKNLCCMECGYIQPNLLEFYYHPCVAGMKITPINLELTLFCCECQCLFPCIDDCIIHFKSCTSMKFIFVRLNTPEYLRVALRRWSLELFANPFLPARQVKFKCSDCAEVYAIFLDFIVHPCPRRQRHERLFIQPIAIQETYSCEACYLVVFSVSVAIEHSKICKQGDHPYMFQIHYNMDEIIAALTPWMRGPEILQFEITIGMGNEEDEIEFREIDYRYRNKLMKEKTIEYLQSREKPSHRLKKYILNKFEKLQTPAPRVQIKLRNITNDIKLDKMKALGINEI